MTRFWDGRSDPTPRPAFAFGDAGNKTFTTSLFLRDKWEQTSSIKFL